MFLANNLSLPDNYAVDDCGEIARHNLALE